jgi:ABC-type branched-subunit amino acid transport system ATPase component
MESVVTPEPGASPVEPEMKPLLEVRGVRQEFGGVVALADVSLDARAGEVYGLIGPNGAGKTTLFDCIAGVRRPKAGTITLNGRDITNASGVTRARLGVTRTFQRQQVFGWLSVEENVLMALEWRGGGGGFVGDLLSLPGRRRRERERRLLTAAALERCGLTDVRTASAGTLSIGYLRRVELARAIVDKPVLLLLDEPSSGLEEPEIAQLTQIIQELRETGCAVLVIEHHLPFVMEVCDRISVLHLGLVIASGSPQEVVREEAVREAYLD